MSLQDGSAQTLRASARALRTVAAGIGLAAWGAQTQVDPVRDGWWNRNGDLWLTRDRYLVDAARSTERGLRALARTTEDYAEDVERLQGDLRRLNEQAAALGVLQHVQVAAWNREPEQTRGPRPDVGAQLASVHLARGWVEQAGEQAGQAFADAVRARLADLPSVVTLRTVLAPGYLYGYALPSAVGNLLHAGGNADLRRVAPIRSPRSLLPRRLHGPLKAFDRRFGLARGIADIDVLRNGSGKTGVRGATDRVMAGVDLAALTLTYGGAAVATVAAAAPTLTGLAVGAAAVGTAVGIGTAGYALVTSAWDHRPRSRPRPRARPSRPVVGARVPLPRPRPRPRSAPRATGARSPVGAAMPWWAQTPTGRPPGGARPAAGPRRELLGAAR